MIDDLNKQEELAEETAAALEETVEETADAVTDAVSGEVSEAVSEETAEGEPAEEAKPSSKPDYEKTEEELAAENEARCEAALATEKFSFSYTMRFSDLAKFNLRHTLGGFSGFIFWFVLVLGIVYLVTSWSDMGGQKRAFIIVLLVFVIWYEPLRSVLNAAKSAKYLREKSTPVEYHVCAEEFVIKQDGQRGVLRYDKIRRLKETKKTLYADVFLNSGFVFPKDLVGEHYDELLAILKAHVGKK